MATATADTDSMDDERSRSLWVLWALAALMAAGATVLLAALDPGLTEVGDAVHVPWFVLAVGFALAELNALHFRFRGETHAFTLNEIVLVLGLFSLTPGGLVATQLLGIAVALAVVRRLPTLKLAYNLAQAALSTTTALVVFRAVGASDGPLAIRTWIATVAAVAAGAIVGLIAISIAIRVAHGPMSLAALVRSLVVSLLGSVVNTMLGLTVVVVASQSVAAATLLIAPTAVVFIAYRAYLSEHAKSEGLGFLYHASELLSGARDLEAGLIALLDFSRDTFHAELAEVVLFGEADEEIGYRTTVGPGARVFRLEPIALDEVRMVLDVADDSGDVVVYRPEQGSALARRNGLDAASMLVATLTDENGVRGGVLVARGRGTAVEDFSKDEIRLFETFANHLGTTMEKSRLSTSLAQLRKLKQELAHQAYHDSLTGLANRLKFRDLVDNALLIAARDGGRVAVMFIDLDDFKTVNDTMGHAAGDRLLEEVAQRIAASVGESGTAARLGGDEFAVLLPEVANDSEVRGVADKILVALGDPVDVEGQSVVAQASIGIATHVGAADAAELMQHADVAMYTAKRNGKGRFDEFEPNMSLTVARRHQVKVGLERALAAGEFVLQYQPVINVGSGAINGVEALVRWKDPEKGLVPPGEFVGVAEETGLIVPIGRYVLAEACRQAAEWNERSPGLRLFVNLSTRQLADDDIVGDVSSALQNSGLPADQLVLEVTETAMMQDIEEAKVTLHALKALGVGIAIDDFGTGFSSLSYLRELPIDVVKIAKQIIDAICESTQDAAFVKGIIELGHVVGMKVVAEGVERVEQYAHLVDMRCDFVQGYYYAPSLEPAEVAAILHEVVAPVAELLPATAG